MIDCRHLGALAQVAGDLIIMGHSSHFDEIFAILDVLHRL